MPILTRTARLSTTARLRPVLLLLTGLAVAVPAPRAFAADAAANVPQDRPFPVRIAQADPNAPAAQPQQPLSTEDSFELQFWDAVKNSSNPDDYRAYLETYPNGRFAALARVRARSAAPSTNSPQPSPVAPIPAPTPTPVSPVVVPVDRDAILAQRTTIRVSPETGGQRIETAEKGERIRVTGQTADGTWLRVLAKSGRNGFVPASDLQPPPDPQPSAQATPQSPPGPQVQPDMPGVSDCPDCPVMKPIQGGTFNMGSNEFYDFEKPVHKVTIRPFLIGQFEVTVGQWRHCVAETACQPRGPAEGDDVLPVTDVTWSDAKAYAGWLSSKTGKHYRLPTESEWEYAMRAGTTTAYYWGKSLIRGRANCAGCIADFTRSVVSVGRYPPNAYGLFDMAGNAAEWVEDCWVDTYKGAPTDGSAVEKPQCAERVLRGGSFINDPRYLRTAARFKYDAEVRYFGNGFRLARDQ